MDYNEDIISRLARQFPFAVVEKIVNLCPLNDEDVSGYLMVGQRVEKAIVILTDIINFSSFVTHCQSEDIAFAMDNYYRESRRAVFESGGVLDKFIGDAVLAIFAYPFRDETIDFKNALSCCANLINIGNQIMAQLNRKINKPDIKTGTRVDT